MRRREVAVVAMLVLVAGCDKKSPVAPMPAEPTRVVRVSGDLAFGNVEVLVSAARQVRIENLGTAPLVVEGMTIPASGKDVFTVSWPGGTIGPGATQDVTVRCKPVAAEYYAGLFRVVGNQTGGNDTLNISCSGVRTGPLWRVTGVGNSVFEIPAVVARVKVTASYDGRCQNFIARIVGKASMVNTILGTCSVASGPRYEGTHLTTGGGTLEITGSEGVAWMFEEAR